MSNRIHNCPIVAYASLAVPAANKGSDLELLRQWCLRVPVETEILAEEIPPNSPNRPLWMEILNEIERGTITTLVVPSLAHIAGDDFVRLAKILTFLKVHKVTLKSLADLIDSRRETNSEIVLKLSKDTERANAKGCA